MVRFLAVYDKPDDPDVFDRHYRQVHIPLAKKLPGLRRYTISRDPASTRDGEAYYLIAELDWDDMDSLRQDFASPLGQEVGRDADNLAEWCPGMQGMICELEEL